MTARLVIPAVAVTLAVVVPAPSTARSRAVNPPQIIQGTPPRDVRQPPQTGTAVIRGRVVAGDTGRPLRRARITVSAPELGRDNRTTSTGLDGRYEIEDLPPGRYTIRVERSGYLGLQYGQRRPLEQGKPLQVADKQVVENINFTLPRSSVIRGHITDEFSEPVRVSRCSPCERCTGKGAAGSFPPAALRRAPMMRVSIGSLVLCRAHILSWRRCGKRRW